MAAKETLERELKLAAPDGFELPDLGGEPLEPRTFTSTYYDTSDHRLARAGITLRRRVEHGKGLWQLKLPEGTARRELEHPGGPAGPPRQLARLLVGPHARARALADRQAPHPTRRIPGCRRREREGGRRTRLGRRHGRPPGDRPVHRARSGAGGRRRAGTRGNLACTQEGRRRQRANAVRRSSAFSASPMTTRPCRRDDAAALRAMLARQHEQILANDPGVRLGDDPEAVHACGSQRAGSAPCSARQRPCSSASGPSASAESSGGSRTS